MTTTNKPIQTSYQLTLRTFLLLMLVPVGNAYAYVDPGSGMLMIQGLLALIGGIVFFLKNPMQTIKSLIARLRKRE